MHRSYCIIVFRLERTEMKCCYNYFGPAFVATCEDQENDSKQTLAFLVWNVRKLYFVRLKNKKEDTFEKFIK